MKEIKYDSRKSGKVRTRSELLKSIKQLQYWNAQYREEIAKLEAELEQPVIGTCIDHAENYIEDQTCPYCCIRELEAELDDTHAALSGETDRAVKAEHRIKAVRKVADNRSMLDDYEAQYIYSALGDFEKEQSDE